MRHLLFKEADSYETAILIKDSSFTQKALLEHYVDPLVKRGANKDSLICFTLAYGQNGKCPKAVQTPHLESLLPALKKLGVKNILCCDSNYFKTLTKERKAEPHYGYVLPCKVKDYEDMMVALAPNYGALFYKPEIQDKLDLALDAMNDHLDGTYKELGADVIHSESYPADYLAIKQALQDLHQYPMLAADIEAFSLNFWETGIGTIGFAWDEHNGIAFSCDYQKTTPDKAMQMAGLILTREPDESAVKFQERKAILAGNLHGYSHTNEMIRELLREFFETYKGKLIWHNANYDLKVVVNCLWMKSLLDEEGKQKGIEIMTRGFHDTKIITYLATNSTSGNDLGLKAQAHEFAGNWAQNEIKDIRNIPEDKLLRYNLVDCLSTWYVYKKHAPTMTADKQLEVYNKLMIPSVKVILQMELTGMPLNMEKVKHARTVLEDEIRKHDQILRNLAFIPSLEEALTRTAWEKDFDGRRKKAKNPDKIVRKDYQAYKDKAGVVFNPGSNPQLQYLLYEMLNLPILDLTDSKQPAVGGDTLKKLKHHTRNTTVHELLDALVELADASKILGTFIKAFEGAVLKEDGWYYLHGNFNIGGTVSGRLSSSGPNLQNIPSTGSKWAKLVKECFQAPLGWIFAGADFASLEDRISALTTRDPMKLKVYTDGYDGHCLRAHAYFGDQMPDIKDTVESINSIAKHPEYKKLRQESKVPTFALTYGGTYHAIMDQTGLPEIEAKQIEDNYHKLYHVSDQWVADKIEQATKDGYVTVAFGLRVRTPLLKQVLWGSKKTPYEAKKEGRTAGNALGQSYGLLNNRAGIEFQEKTLESDFRYDVLPVAHIHDAQYFMIRDDSAAVKFANDGVTEAMKWQDLPEIYHPDVPLGGELDIFYPNWANDITLPNNISEEQIINICTKEAA